METFVKRMIIDKEKNFTPRRVIKKGGVITEVFTDHFTVKVILKELPRCRKEVEKVVTWNLIKQEAGNTTRS